MLQNNYNIYMEAIKMTMDKHAPLTTKMKTKRDNNTWFNKDSQKLKPERRMAEKRWIKSKQQQDLLDYKPINSIYKNTCITPKTHILCKINDNENKTRNLYKIFKSLTKLKDDNLMPPIESPSDLPNKFTDFFLNKIKNPKNSFKTRIHINHTIENVQNSLVFLH